MARELFLRLINQHLYGQLLLIALVCSFSWIIVMKLQLRIVEAQVSLKKILPYAVFGSLVIFFIIKLYLPTPIAALAQIVLMVIFLKVLYAKVRLIAAFWATFISLMSTTLGSYMAFSLLCLWNKNIRTFLLTNEYGIMLGILAETAGPAILLHILSTFKFSAAFLFSKKLTRIDLIGVLTFGLMYYTLYNSTIRFVSTIKIHPNQMINAFFSDLGSILASVLGAFLVVASIQKMREIEQRRYEREQQNHENEQRINQAKITALNKQNSELKKIIEYLNNLKVKPQKLINDVTDAINNVTSVVNQLKDYSGTMDNSDYILLNLDKINILIGCELKTNEKLILQGIINNKTFQEIGDSIHLEEGSVKNIASELYKKFKVRNKKELIKYIVDNALNE